MVIAECGVAGMIPSIPLALKPLKMAVSSACAVCSAALTTAGRSSAARRVVEIHDRQLERHAQLYQRHDAAHAPRDAEAAIGPEGELARVDRGILPAVQTVEINEPASGQVEPQHPLGFRIDLFPGTDSPAATATEALGIGGMKGR
jgi:hypothetical protein